MTGGPVLLALAARRVRWARLRFGGVLLVAATALAVVHPWSMTTASRAQAAADVPPGPRIYTLVGNGAPQGFEAPAPSVGSRATEISTQFSGDVAVAANGDVLVDDYTRVWRIGPDGMMRVAAGNGRQQRNTDLGNGNGDGGPAGRAFVDDVVSIAALADGGFLIAEHNGLEGRVRRVGADGTISTVAGGEFEGRHRGDGGPASRARIDPMAIAATADGGYLILERARVRRVAPDGTITTVAGTGVEGFSGDGGPAIRARIHPCWRNTSCEVGGDIAATPDGGFLLADTNNHRIRKVAADGRITTVAGDGRPMPHAGGVPAVRASINTPSAVAATPEGGFGFVEDVSGTLREVKADGTITTVTGAAGGWTDAAGVPVGDGGPARDALSLMSGRGLVSTPEGGWVFTELFRVRHVTPAMPQRLDAAVVSVSGRAGAPVVRVSSTGAGLARLTLRTAANRAAASATQSIAPGDTSIALSPVKPGRYWVDLTVSDASQRFTSTRLAVVLGTSLPEGAARHAVEYRLAEDFDINLELEVEVGNCHRVNRRRVDCETHRGTRCTGILAVTLRNAFTFVRRYGCRSGVRRSPHWLEAAQPWPVLGEPPG